MIRWPADKKLTPDAKTNLERFRQTAAAKALEAESQTWHFQNWSWTTDAPVRLILENPDHHVLTFTLDGHGMWTMREANVSPHIRAYLPSEDEIAAKEAAVEAALNLR
jgi:hypothetical protein